MTMEAIMAVMTSVVTFLFGLINKRFNLTDSNLIPLQNLTVGFLTGCICFACGLMDNAFNSIVICTIAAFGAGGFYDLSKTGSGKDED